MPRRTATNTRLVISTYPERAKANNARRDCEVNVLGFPARLA